MSALGRPLRSLDIPFDRVPVEAISSGGSSYTRWATTGMPKLGEYQYLLDIVFFLYPDEASAVSGGDLGGTGFFVAMPSEKYPEHFHHIYAVTNWHVAVEGGSSVIRVNRIGGGFEIFSFEPHEWEFIPGGHDIAVIPIPLDPRKFKAEALLVDSFFLTKKESKKLEINAADDVFMLGRFIDYDGAGANHPAMRFGHISMVKAKVPQPTGGSPSSIVVDMHSRTGYSGSPVFVYRTHGSVFAKAESMIFGGHLMKLLGILWGQFPEAWEIKDGVPKHLQSASPAVLDGKHVRGWSGMSLVSPAWAIKDVLNTPRLVELRQEAERRLPTILGVSPSKLSWP